MLKLIQPCIKVHQHKFTGFALNISHLHSSSTLHINEILKETRFPALIPGTGKRKRIRTDMANYIKPKYILYLLVCCNCTTGMYCICITTDSITNSEQMQPAMLSSLYSHCSLLPCPYREDISLTMTHEVSSFYSLGPSVY